MKDAHAPEKRFVSLQHAFEVSSNVGISGVIYKNYKKEPQKFLDKINSFHLNEPLGLQISGEAMPRIKNSTDKDWSLNSLPWTSIGYELKLTPLQLLTFYNAVANNGKMVRPIFVKQVLRRGEDVQTFKTQVIKTKICSDSTIARAHRLLEGVVQNGTASNLKNANYKIAGKTGTAQIARGAGGYKDEEDGK